MHLPAPIRAAIGLVATAADEVKSLPDRAVELPMLAVSTALQVSLRAQQRYALLAARGEKVLNREEPGEEPPAWATFDEPVPAEDLRRSALTQLDNLIDGSFGGPGGDDADTAAAGDGQVTDPTARSAGRMFEQLFGVADPAAGSGSDPIPGNAAPEPSTTDDALDGLAASDAPAEHAVVVPITQATAAGRGARKSARKSSRKTPAKKAAAKSAPVTEAAKPAAKKTAAKKAAKSAAGTPAKKAAAKKTADEKAAPDGTPSDTAAGKPVNKPRHTAPSKFDDVDG